MASKSDKERRKQLLHSTREDDRRKVREALPLPASTFKALFDYVDQRLADAECDNTLRYVREFIHSHNLPEEAVIGWLEDNHGYCDCEAIMNSEEVVEDAVPGYRDVKPEA